MQLPSTTLPKMAVQYSSTTFILKIPAITNLQNVYLNNLLKKAADH